jgi:hypothetical protein
MVAKLVVMVGRAMGKQLKSKASEKGECKRQDCYDGVQQQKRVTGFCRVLARARLTACKNSRITWR